MAKQKLFLVVVHDSLVVVQVYLEKFVNETIQEDDMKQKPIKKEWLSILEEKNLVPKNEAHIKKKQDLKI